MIDPESADKGRAVIYRPRPDAEPEEGVITAFSVIAAHVFVRFRGPQGELTPCDKLEWKGTRANDER